MSAQSLAGVNLRRRSLEVGEVQTFRGGAGGALTQTRVVCGGRAEGRDSCTFFIACRRGRGRGLRFGPLVEVHHILKLANICLMLKR